VRDSTPCGSLPCNSIGLVYRANEEQPVVCVCVLRLYLRSPPLSTCVLRVLALVPKSVKIGPPLGFNPYQEECIHSIIRRLHQLVLRYRFHRPHHGELNKLSTHDKYTGNDHVPIAEGTCMNISHIGHSILRTSHGLFDLKNILHVPSALKNLLYVHRFTLDVFIEFHPFLFLIKNQATRIIMFRGPCYGGFYPLVHMFNETSMHAFITINPSSST
jgi:hypothetical protein